jgi:2-polyprenyl-3-methyl-5-hydroxy-6-metoxy-1,4-benzoquinol methylase
MVFQTGESNHPRRADVLSSMSCPVCLNAATVPSLTGADLLFESSPRTFTLNACPSCRCLFLNPMPGNEEIAGFYPAQYWWNSAKPGALKKLESIYRKGALSGHIAFITRAAGHRNGLDLLDVGCGSGTLPGLLRQRGFRTMGVDFSAEAAQVAASENGVRVIVGSLMQAAFSDRSFDIVTLFHVMEHVTNPREVLSEVSRILRPDGVVVLQVPNIDSWQFKAFGAKWYGLDIPRHVIDYSKSAMLRLLADSGFEPLRIKHFNMRDNAPALASSMFPSLDPVSRAVRQRKHGVSEATLLAWARHLAYLCCVVCAYPFAILESAFGCGATLMIEAKKR